MEDSIFSGSLQILQPARGYRVNVDTLLLADFATRRRPQARRLADLGAGVGALALAFARLGTVRHCDLLERESSLADLARTNLARGGVDGTVHVLDLARDQIPRPLRGAIDVVVSNPPFFAAGSASAITDTARGRARAGALEPFLRAAAAVMAGRGYAFFVYPAPALPEFLAVARRAQLVAKGLRLVHAYPDAPARLALVELRRAKPGGLIVSPPVIEWRAPGERSPELAALVAGKPLRS